MPPLPQDRRLLLSALSAAIEALADGKLSFLDGRKPGPECPRERLSNEYLHHHEAIHEIAIILDGPFVMNCGGSPVRLRETCLHLPPGLPHRERPAKSRRPYRALNLAMTQRVPPVDVWVSYANGAIPYPGLRSSGHFRCKLLPPSAAVLDALGSSNRLDQRYAANALLNLLIDLWRGLHEPAPSAADHRAPSATMLRAIRQADAFLAEHAAQPISVFDVADHVGYSADHLTRIYKEQFGITPHQKMNALRLARAEALLRNTNLKVAEIARACGFPLPGYFHAAFKEHHRLTPAAFRHQAGPPSGPVAAKPAP